MTPNRWVKETVNRNPATTIAALPAKDLRSSNGFGHFLPVFPNRLPTISATPSPPHMSDTTKNPTGDSLQNSNVVTIKTIV
ncbi:unnamed protein product [Bathycoccus prasinos]